MSQVESHIAKLEAHLVGIKEQVKLAEDIRILLENVQFRKVIMEEFSTKEAARYVAASADPCLNQEQRADSLGMAQAAGYLKRWIGVQLQQAAVADSSIKEVEDEIVYARQSED